MTNLALWLAPLAVLSAGAWALIDMHRKGPRK